MPEAGCTPEGCARPARALRRADLYKKITDKGFLQAVEMLQKEVLIG